MTDFTFGMIKANTVGRGQAMDILHRITAAGFMIRRIAQRKLCLTTINAFYNEHKDKPYFKDLAWSVSGIQYDEKIQAFVMAPGAERPVIGFTLVLDPDRSWADDVITEWRRFIGSTKSSEAARGTLRNMYGGHNYMKSAPIADNAVHGSDSPKRAKFEADLFFKGA